MTRRSSLNIIIYHLIAIIIFILSELIIIFFYGSNAGFWEFVGFYTIDISFFYISTYFYIKWTKKDGIKLTIPFLGLSILWVVLFTVLDLYYSQMIYYFNGRSLKYQQVKELGAKLICRFSYFYLLAYGFWAARTLVRRERDLRNKDVALLTAENDKAQVEIALLRSQITPHLMLNTLNGVYNLVMTTNPRAAVMVELLMDNLQLSLKGSKPDKVTLLREEIQLVKNIVNLYSQLGKANCVLDVALGKEILEQPFPVNIIATLVENVFKHGDLSDESNPALISISEEQSRVKVEVCNRVYSNGTATKSGIGIANIDNRLAILFKDRYKLTTYRTETYYQTHLEIEI